MNHINTRPRERAQAPRWCFLFDEHVDHVAALSLAESGDIEWRHRAFDEICRRPALHRRRLLAVTARRADNVEAERNV